MDTTWWNRRTLTNRKVVIPDGPYFVGKSPWIRWRLIDELLTRFYADFGLEPAFGYLGVELYNVGLWSPHCKRAPRYFGRLCGQHHFHAEDDSQLMGVLVPGIRYAALRADRDIGDLGERDTWDSWNEYLRDAITSLGLERAGVKGHEGCFHRRGKSLLQVMYRTALILRTEETSFEVPEQDRRSLLSYPPLNGQVAGEAEEVDEIVRISGVSSSGPLAAYFAVRRLTGRWIAIRTDGWVATASGPVDAAALWRGGWNERQIASEVARRAKGG